MTNNSTINQTFGSRKTGGKTIGTAVVISIACIKVKVSSVSELSSNRSNGEPLILTVKKCSLTFTCLQSLLV